MSNNFANYIPDDGYTEPGYIAPVAALHSGLRFHFRPLLVAQQSAWDKATSELKGDQWYRKSAETMAGRLKDWDLIDVKDAAGGTLAITRDNILRLKPSLFTRLHGILWGSMASDEDPQWGEAEKDDATNLASDSSVSEVSPGVAREVANEKNSGQG
jgi:hypothetical protein